MALGLLGWLKNSYGYRWRQSSRLDSREGALVTEIQSFRCIGRRRQWQRSENSKLYETCTCVLHVCVCVQVPGGQCLMRRGE